MCKDKYRTLINADILHGRYMKVDFDFDEFNKRLKCVKKVSLNREDWMKSDCTCSYFHKHYYCYHIMAVAVKNKLFEIPIKYINTQIEANKARGRKSKMSKALEKDPNPPAKRRKVIK